MKNTLENQTPAPSGRSLIIPLVMSTASGLWTGFFLCVALLFGVDYLRHAGHPQRDELLIGMGLGAAYAVPGVVVWFVSKHPLKRHPNPSIRWLPLLSIGVALLGSLAYFVIA